MTKDTTYNGYTNYETWNCALWIDNDQGSQEYWLEQAKFLDSEAGYEAHKGRYMGAFDDKPDRLAVNALAEQLKEHFEEQAETWMHDQASFFADIFNAALGEVNWHEIAAGMMDTAKEQD